MSQRTDAVVISTIGIDTGKNTLHLVGLDDQGAIVLREKVARGRIRTRFANVAPCLIGIEAGMATFRDAYAIAEAVQRPTTRCVPVKTDDQLDLQALHRVRSRLVGQRTAVINQIRSFLLERGIAVRQGLRFLRQQLPEIQCWQGCSMIWSFWASLNGNRMKTKNCIRSSPSRNLVRRTANPPPRCGVRRQRKPSAKLRILTKTKLTLQCGKGLESDTQALAILPMLTIIIQPAPTYRPGRRSAWPSPRSRVRRILEHSRFPPGVSAPLIL